MKGGGVSKPYSLLLVCCTHEASCMLWCTGEQLLLLARGNGRRDVVWWAEGEGGEDERSRGYCGEEDRSHGMS